MTIEALTPKNYTPQICLNDILQDIEKVESVVCLVKYKDGTAQTWASWMRMTEMAYLAKVLDRRIYNLLESSAEENG